MDQVPRSASTGSGPNGADEVPGGQVVIASMVRAGLRLPQPNAEVPDTIRPGSADNPGRGSRWFGGPLVGPRREDEDQLPRMLRKQSLQ